MDRSPRSSHRNPMGKLRWGRAKQRSFSHGQRGSDAMLGTRGSRGDYFWTSTLARGIGHEIKNDCNRYGVSPHQHSCACAKFSGRKFDLWRPRRDWFYFKRLHGRHDHRSDRKTIGGYRDAEKHGHYRHITAGAGCQSAGGRYGRVSWRNRRRDRARQGEGRKNSLKNTI